MEKLGLMATNTEIAFIITKLFVKSESRNSFVDWQAKFNAEIAAFPGFVSLEISTPHIDGELFMWVVVQSFVNQEHLTSWINSQTRLNLFNELDPLLDGGMKSIRESELGAAQLKGEVTEIFVTQVSPDRQEAYRKWIAKIHQVEAKFPGFRGVYVQSPNQGQGKSWITLLQFDTVENLDFWLSSQERRDVLNESESLITSIENHRVISPYAGWFGSVANGGEPPAVWKQTMIVLLVLFPIVMLELKYLSPWTVGLNPALATFIGNALSVLLISWPMVPISIKFLKWWLSPKAPNQFRKTIAGTAIVISLYLLEMIILWNLL